jgi:hypothetical protein
MNLPPTKVTHEGVEFDSKYDYVELYPNAKGQDWHGWEEAISELKKSGWSPVELQPPHQFQVNSLLFKRERAKPVGD